ncbi:hypothetical protein PANO111632_02685 [Paracoccus nototheniae]|uniref:Uncharacterized protein n=1 Tax=Paracoccus nototheniae TaxID=2489002 RepID=A0ABW4DZR8_9RHOB
MTMTKAKPLCQKCHGAGVISRPYMTGMKGGDLSTITVCGCEKPSDMMATKCSASGSGG